MPFGSRASLSARWVAKETSPSAWRIQGFLARPTLSGGEVQYLVDVLHRLVDEGHTVVVIERHMAVAADAGGQIIAQGPPEKIAKSKTSRTAPFLKSTLGTAAKG